MMKDEEVRVVYQYSSPMRDKQRELSKLNLQKVNHLTSYGVFIVIFVRPLSAHKLGHLLSS